MTAKETRAIIAQYEQAGFRVEKHKHYKVFSSSGQLVAVLPSSQCGGRADRNAKAQLKRVIRLRQDAVA